MTYYGVFLGAGTGRLLAGPVGQAVGVAVGAALGGIVGHWVMRGAYTVLYEICRH